MNFRDFQAKYSNYSVIRSSYFSLEENPFYLRRLVSEWLQKKWLISLKRGIYIFNSKHILDNIEKFEIANLLYQPSYISLESALSFHGLIPEFVPQISSICTRKTMYFINELGSFKYSNIKKKLFWGYKQYKVGNKNVLIAIPEKALIDIIYLRKGEFYTATEVIESLRLQNIEKLDYKLLKILAKKVENLKVTLVIEDLLMSNYIN